MRVIKLLHNLLKKTAPIVHSKRIMALLNAAESLMIGKRLTLSGLARSIKGNCLPKTAIRKIDRLLGNKHIHSERSTYYKCLCLTLRMEIEEEFRDLKDPRNGFGLKYSGTKSNARIQVLLLIAALASFMCWLIATTLKRRKEHYAYQANTIRDKNVLSVHFLACEALRRLGKKIKISNNDIINSLTEIRHYCLEASYG